MAAVRRLRVVHVHKMTGIGGSENHLKILLPALAKRGLAVRLIVLVEPGREEFMERYAAALEGVETDAVTIRHHLDPGVVLRLRDIMTRWKPDLAHTHLIHADVHGTAAAALCGVPVVSSRHNDDPFRRRKSIQLGMRCVTAMQKRVIAISGAVAEFTEKVEGVPRERIRVVRYGMDPVAADADGAAAFRGAQEGKLLVTVGRLVPQKGQEDLIDAIALLRERPVRLSIVGSGPLQEELEARVNRRGLEGKVELAGFRADIAEVMGACDVYVHPSHWEGFGLVLLEAMAAGRPIVATSVSAIPEVVRDGETGLLVPARDPERLAKAIEWMLDDPAAARAMGEKGRWRLEAEFSVEKMVEGTLRVYEEAAA